VQTQTLLGIDTGGTFTDFVYLDPEQNQWRVHKVLSTPTAPQEAILRGIEELGLTQLVKAGQVTIVHGTTVATNAALEGKGARTAYIANEGMKDVIRIGRQTREDLYSLHPTKLSVPVDVDLLFEVPSRLSSDGDPIQTATDADLDELEIRVRAAKPEAIAINLLFSYLNPEHELRIAERFKDFFVSRSSEILPEYKEYERGASTWVNSWMGPRIQSYMTALRDELVDAPLAIMQSSGLTIDAKLAADRAVNLLLSGPAGGLSAASFIAEQTSRPRMLTFDMGGTSTDVALLDGDITLTSEGSIRGIPIAIPMADIHTIGAGGGSVAHVDSGGLLKVGPESAGAYPGPACYGQGGEKPTVTDANLLLGHLDASVQLADGLVLDVPAAERAIGQLATELNQSVIETAQGIVAIANEHMVQALRVISIQRGYDPRQFNLVCFGGAGGLHVCDIADALDMTEILVPINSGVLSALGMLTTQPGRELSKTVQTPVRTLSVEDVVAILDETYANGAAELAAEGVMEYSRQDSLELRYAGQTSTLNIRFNGNIADAVAAFEAAHKNQFGHTLDREVEILNCRVHLEASRPKPQLPQLGDASSSIESSNRSKIRREHVPVGQTLKGPCLVLDDHATVRVKDGWSFQMDSWGHLVLTKN
jgi:N-methylhydantoinase A